MFAACFDRVSESGRVFHQVRQQRVERERVQRVHGLGARIREARSADTHIGEKAAAAVALRLDRARLIDKKGWTAKGEPLYATMSQR